MNELSDLMNELSDLMNEVSGLTNVLLDFKNLVPNLGNEAAGLGFGKGCEESSNFGKKIWKFVAARVSKRLAIKSRGDDFKSHRLRSKSTFLRFKSRRLETVILWS